VTRIMGINEDLSQTVANRNKPKHSNLAPVHGSTIGREDISYDYDALVDVVAYLLERRRRRLAESKSDGVS